MHVSIHTYVCIYMHVPYQATCPQHIHIHIHMYLNVHACPHTGMPPAPRYHHSAVVFSDSMFVFGGYTGDIYSNSNLRNKNDLHQYKFTTSQWINWEDRITGDLPPARSAHGAAVYNGHLWIFAGYDGHTRLNDMWCVSLTDSQPQWEQVEQNGDSPPTCCNFPVAMVDDSMYVFSGQSGAKITNKLYRFRFQERRWVRIRTEHLVQPSAPPQRRYGHTMVALRRSLYVYGGAADGILDNVVHCFDVDTHTWSVISPADGSEVPCGRVFHSAAVWNNRMYIFGGTIDSLSNRSGDLFRFSFSTFPKCSLVNDFARLLEMEEFCDVHFVLREGVVVKAHVGVVAARSPYLRRRILEVHHNKHSYASHESLLLDASTTPTAVSPPARMEETTALVTKNEPTFAARKDDALVASSDSPFAFVPKKDGVQSELECFVARKPRAAFVDRACLVPKEDQVTPVTGTDGVSPVTGTDIGIASVTGTDGVAPVTGTDGVAPASDEDAFTATMTPPFLIDDPISLHLEDVSGEVFKLALHSLYTDQIHTDLENYSSKGVSVPQMLLMVDIYKLSLLLETKRLEFLSIKYIEGSINEENVLLVLKNATEMGLTSLKDYCMRFIIQDSNYRKVVMSNSFEGLDKNLMVQIIRRQLFRSRPTSPDPPSVLDSSDVPPSLQDDLEGFLDGESGRAFADVVLRVGPGGDQVVLAHRAVLIARCAYFEALFRSFTPQNHQVEITFGEVVPSLSAFMALLRHTYCGEIDVSPDDALYIFSAPNFFGFANSRLHSHCKVILERDVDQGNVLRILETADTISMLVMKKHCLDMIAANFPSIVQQRYFRSLRRELLLDIFDILASRMVDVPY